MKNKYEKNEGMFNPSLQRTGRSAVALGGFWASRLTDSVALNAAIGQEEEFDMTTKRQRVGMVISGVWLILIIGLNIGNRDAANMIFLFGVLPMAIGWGIWWIRRAKQ